MNQNNKFDNFSNNFTIDWTNQYCSKLEDIYDSYLNSKHENKIICFFSKEQIDINKKFLSEIYQYLDKKTICELIDCKNDEINDKLKLLYRFLNQCKKYLEEYEKKYNAFKKCILKCFDPKTGEYLEDIEFKYIDRLYSIYSDINLYQFENEFKKINKKITSFSEFKEELKIKRSHCSQLEKLKILAENIHNFLNLGKHIDIVFKQSEATKIYNKFKCIPKIFKNKFIQDNNIPEDLNSILNKAIYCFNGRKKNSLGT